MSGHAHHGPPGAPSTAAPPEGVKAPEVSSAKLLATLALAGAAAGLLIVAVYRATLPTIEKYEAAKVERAVREVLKAPARWDTLYLQAGALTRAPTGADDRKDLAKAYLGFDAAGTPVGVAVTAQEPGFQQEILLMIGFEPGTGEVIGFRVIEEKKTPGLGDKIESDTAFTSQLPGSLAPLSGVKARNAADRHQVQTITGATISSRAVIRIINHAVERWRPLLAAYDKGAAK